MKEYFPVSKVVPSILEIYRQLLNVRFYPVPRTAEAGGMTWHEGQSSILLLCLDETDEVSRC